MKICLDHLVIGASTLQQGVNYVKESLGVDIPPGGQHLKMGTHNHLMQLGNNVFLEVIAINPHGDSPGKPRWYGLDDPFIKAQIEKQPQLLTWVVNTSNMKEFQTRSAFSFGMAEPVNRGDLSWHFGIPDDGRLLAGGMLPYVIEWHTDTHPSERMENVGCSLQGLEIYHPQSGWLESILSAIDAVHLVSLYSLPDGTSPYLVAHIQTPSGVKELSSKISNF